MTSIENQQKELESIFLSGALKAVNLFQVNDKYFHLPEKGLWIIDGGIELVFPGGTCCVGWSTDYESFVFEKKAFDFIYLHDNFVQFDPQSIPSLSQLVGHNVLSANFKSIDVESVLDYTMRTETEKKFVEMVLEFDNHSHLQIGAVTYSLEKNEFPKDLIIELHGELLVSTQEIIEIGDVND